MKDKLLPCPFCGGEVDYVPDPSQVWCRDCCFQIEDDCKESTIKRWNTRTLPASEGGDEKLLRIMMGIMEEYGMPKFTDKIPAMDLLQHIKDFGYLRISEEALARALVKEFSHFFCYLTEGENANWKAFVSEARSIIEELRK